MRWSDPVGEVADPKCVRRLRYNVHGWRRRCRAAAVAAACRRCGPSRTPDRSASCGRTACRSSAGRRPPGRRRQRQYREESGVKTSSASTQVAVLVDAELELGVGDDDSLRQRVVGGLDVGLQGAVAQLVGPDGADQFDDVVERDVLVVLAQFGFGGRGEQRLVELAGLDEARRQRDAADLAGLLVVDAGRSRSGSRGPRTPPAASRARAPPARGRAPRRGCARSSGGPARWLGAST